MKKIILVAKNFIQRRAAADRFERGQILIIVTLAMIGLVSFVGLVVDVGLLFVGQGRLRRAVDAAALAAASNFRQGYAHADLEKSALEFLKLNGFENPDAAVDTCDSLPGDLELCPGVGEYAQKLVRVNASATVPLAFLSVIGIRDVPISAEAIGEAASLDVVLVIDTSDSMAKEGLNSEDRDPSVCNPMNCSPFDAVKIAAIFFKDQLDYPYDRVALVGFDQTATIALNFSSVPADIGVAINAMEVFEPSECSYNPYYDPLVPTPDGPCRIYERYADCESGAPWANGNCNEIPEDEAFIDEDGLPGYDNYLGPECPIFHDTGNPSTCTTTNIGGAIAKASETLADTDPAIGGRRDALWVVILLTDGAANAPASFCPSDWWENPFCRSFLTDAAWKRYCVAGTYTYCTGEGGVVDPAKYNTDDYARDMFDFVGREQEALIYTIGLGDQVQTSLPVVYGKGAGERLLEYGARVGEGAAIFVDAGGQLVAAFGQILDSISTRLAK